MANFIIPIAKEIKRRGKKVMIYREGSKFISKKRFDFLNSRNAGTGKFLSKGERSRRGTLQQQENNLRAQLGAPPAGHTWVKIANKYEDRFEGYL